MSTAYPTLVHALLHWERLKPTSIYLTQPDAHGVVTHYCWVAVADQVRRAATHLRSLALPPGSNIALLGKNSAHWIMADLAIALAGHVSVPLYPTLNANTARYVLDHSEARLLIVGKLDGLSDAWKEIREVLPAGLPLLALPMAPDCEATLWTDVVLNTAPDTGLAPPAPDALATILYTSGSTGRPKGVMHCHAVIARGAQALCELLGVTDADRMLSYLPLAHVAERIAVGAVSVRSGCRVFFADRLETFAQDLARARPTIFFSVPRLWTKFHLAVNEKLPERRQKLLFRLPLVSRVVKKKLLARMGLDQVRVAMTGSAPLPQKIIDWYRGLGLELLELYGMSENLAYSHAARPGQTRIGYVGHAMPGVQVRIAANGELLVKSPCQMLGYYKDAEKTAAETTADGYFHTGDRGELDDEGRVRITGRVKELFKTAKGKYVAPAPIENRIASHPAIESVCVTGAGQAQAFALMTLSPESQKELATAQGRANLEQTLGGLLKQVNAALEDHERLACFVVTSTPWTIETGELTPTLKIKRDVIEQRYQPQSERWAAARAPVVWN